MRAAVAQMTSTGHARTNLETVVRLIRRAAAGGAKAVFLPEASDYITTAQNAPGALTSPDHAPFIEGVRKAAKAGNVYVSVGVHEPQLSGEHPEYDNVFSADQRTLEGDKNGDSVRGWNTQLLIDPTGKVLSAYRKLHLFNVDILGKVVISESNTTLSGLQLNPPIETALGTIGLLTCYDMRFPEPSLALRRLGAEILTYPSAFTSTTGRSHWDLLLRARAIETQSYIIAAAQVGTHVDAPKRSSWGAAMIISPWGDVLARCPDAQGGEGVNCEESMLEENEGRLAYAEIDLERLKEIRRDMPLWQQRRTDVYPIV